MGVSAWLKITQDMVDDFAELTHDRQFIHVDAEKAKLSPFGGTIAHGLLTLSLLSRFASEDAGIVAVIEDMEMALNYGLDAVRFLHPVRVGQRVRARITLIDIQQKSDKRFLLRHKYEVEIEGEEKPALVAQWLLMQITK